MNKIRLVLMQNGHTEHICWVEMVLPKVGEIISHKDYHYDVRFIQYVMSTFLDQTHLDYILVTAIREVARDKK